MKAYEVFPYVPHYDPDGNELYEREDGLFFLRKSDAEKHLREMFDDKETNKALRSGCNYYRHLYGDVTDKWSRGSDRSYTYPAELSVISYYGVQWYLREIEIN